MLLILNSRFYIDNNIAHGEIFDLHIRNINYDKNIDGASENSATPISSSFERSITSTGSLKRKQSDQFGSEAEPYFETKNLSAFDSTEAPLASKRSKLPSEALTSLDISDFEGEKFSILMKEIDVSTLTSADFEQISGNFIQNYRK